MSDPTRNDTNPGDEETLRMVDDVLAAQREGTPDPAGPATPAGFYAALADSAPSASERFRRDLRSRLMDAYAETDPALGPDDTDTTPSSGADENLRWTPPPMPTRPHSAPAQSLTPKRPWPVPRRAVSLVAGLAGVALLAVLLANMATLLQRRNVTSTPTPLPAANPSLSLSVDKFGPDHPVDAAGVKYFEWSPDGQRVATAFGNNIDIWDAATGRLLNRIEVTGTTALSWSPDGRSLAAGAGSNTVRVLDPSNGRQTTSMTGPYQPPEVGYDPYEVRVLAWSPDGSRLASIAAEDLAVRVWDVASAAEAYSITVPASAFQTPTTSETPYPAPGTPTALPQPPRSTRAFMKDVSWSPDGAYIATSYARYSGPGIAFWDAATGRLLFSLPPQPAVGTAESARAVSWMPGRARAAVAVGRVTQIWDVRSGTQVIAMPEPPPPPLPVPTQVPTVLLPNFTPPPTYPPPPLPTNEFGQPIYPPASPFFPTPTTGPPYVHSAERYDEVTEAVWSPDGTTLATSDGVHIRLWDTATGTQKQRLAAGTTVIKVAWMAGGDVLATLEGLPLPDQFGAFPERGSMGTGTIRLWDAKTGTQLRTVLEGKVSDFYPSPTGNALAIHSGSSVMLWTDTAPPPPTPSATPTLNLTPVIISEPADPLATPEPPCGAWNIVPGPDLGGAEADLRAVAAVPGSPDDVWAVGYVRESGQPRTLITRWDGAQWRRVPSPGLGTGNNFLNGVGALAPNDVWAVGYYSATMEVQQALALHWNGTTWTEVPLGDAASEGSTLNAVSGTGPNDVWAVGSVGGRFTLALHWDGARWTRTSAPSPGIEANSLMAVLAISPGEVWAGGRYVNRYEPRGGDPGRPYVLRWDGSQWKSMPAPGDATHGTQAIGPSGISGLAATGPGDIWSVGSIIDIRSAGSVDRWHDPFWFTSLYQYSIDNAGGGYSTRLNALAALGADDIWAVGSIAGFENPGPSGSQLEQPLAFHWNGKQWARAQSLAIPDTEARLQSAAAVSAYDVWAVGSLTPTELAPDGAREGATSPLIMHYTGPGCGTPTPRPTPPPAQATCDPEWRFVPGSYEGPLNDVAALSANEAWAVGTRILLGDAVMYGVSYSLIQRWNGAAWSPVDSPNARRGENVLYAVDAISSDDIWVLGTFAPQPDSPSGTSPQSPVVLHGNGREWPVVGISSLPQQVRLNAVEVVAPNDVWIVGTRSDANGTYTLAMHWDGSRWSEVPTPNPSRLHNTLSAIAAVAPNDVWAVGDHYDPALEGGSGGEPLDRTLILRWDGREWRQVPTPNLPDLGNRLAAIGALSPNDVWAVGSAWGSEGTGPLSMHWDGREWTLIPVPWNQGDAETVLTGVAGVSSSDVWAVGNIGSVGWLYHWDGASWTAVQPPAPPDARSGFILGTLTAISASSDGDIWAAGRYGSGGLTLHYSRTACRTPTP